MKSTWQEVDEALRSIAERRAALDAEEAKWLREAEMLQLWRPLGRSRAGSLYGEHGGRDEMAERSGEEEAS